jgi:peptidoglycan/xylan/chitin deacetylase (PgdA/CDA1 family)
MLRPIQLLLLPLFLSGITLCAADPSTKSREPVRPPPVRTIYLTFDDGPLEGSEDVDDAVRREKIPIDVFVVGSHALASERLKSYCVLYETNEWIEVGNHSYSHAHDDYRVFYAKPDVVLQDFLKNEKAFHITNKLARLPGRNMWRLKDRNLDDVKSGSAAADILFANAFKVFGWDLEWTHDAKTGAPVQTVNDMLFLIDRHFENKRTATENHLVILCHDEMFRKRWEETELKELIDKLRAKGYVFGRLSDYP